MAVNTRRSRQSRRNDKQPLLVEKYRRPLLRYFPAWIVFGMMFLLILPELLTFVLNTTIQVATATPGILLNTAETAAESVIYVAGDMVVFVGDAISDIAEPPPHYGGEIAPLFTAPVQHWSADISRWADEYDLDPNLLATVMQIESCGHPTVSSVAGAQGLFQVMPFHFASDEDQLDPDTNAMRGAAFLNECLDWASGDTGLAMACYNGGPSVISRPMDTWYDEPRRYYRWGTGIYADAVSNSSSSDTLDAWLAAGGANLCDSASSVLSSR